MVRVVWAVCAGLALGGCVGREKVLADAKARWVGTPISERIAALGPPENVVRLGPDRVAYSWVTNETRVTGGDVTYNRLFNGVVASREASTIFQRGCRAIYITDAANDATPLYQRRIVDVDGRCA